MTILAEISEEKLLAIVTPVAIIISYILQRLDHKKVALGVKAVQESGNQRSIRLAHLEVQHAVGQLQQNQIYELSNSGMQEMKRLYMLGMVRLAQITGEDADQLIADKATQMYDEHKAKQILIHKSIAEARATATAAAMEAANTVIAAGAAKSDTTPPAK